MSYGKGTYGKIKKRLPVKSKPKPMGRKTTKAKTRKK